jgi:DNA-binding MarR family transcriptional regulator
MEPGFPERPLIGLLLRLVYQHYSQDIDAALREAGFGDIRPGAANVFPFVPPEGITVSRLAELARVRKQSMAQAVDQLEASGYVERRPNPRDQRSRLVLLTDRGRSVPPVTHAAAQRVEERWAELNGPAEFDALRASLLRLLTELRNQ